MRIGKYETSEKSTAGTAVTFLMIGIGAGALIALLLAPKTGKQMRKELRRKYDDARDTLQDWSEDARDRVNDAVDKREGSFRCGCRELRHQTVQCCGKLLHFLLKSLDLRVQI